MTEAKKQLKRYTGNFKGEDITFVAEFVDYVFTDEECEALLNGQEIKIYPTSKKTGEKYPLYGSLGLAEYNGREFIKFIPDFSKRVPDSFRGHNFSEEEISKLKSGKVIEVYDLISQKTGKFYTAFLMFDKDRGMRMSFDKDNFD